LVIGEKSALHHRRRVQRRLNLGRPCLGSCTPKSQVAALGKEFKLADLFFAVDKLICEMSSVKTQVIALAPQGVVFARG
jgi:hypothetical protein